MLSRRLFLFECTRKVTGSLALQKWFSGAEGKSSQHDDESLDSQIRRFNSPLLTLSCTLPNGKFNELFKYEQ